MTGIVEQLRKATDCAGPFVYRQTMIDASAEIERLRQVQHNCDVALAIKNVEIDHLQAENRRLRAACGKAAERRCTYPPALPDCDCFSCIARRALAPKQEEQQP